MAIEISLETTVLPDGRIELRAPEFVPGQHATVVIRIDEEEPAKMTITERLAQANYRGGSLFKTAEEVDAYIREERESWER